MDMWDTSGTMNSSWKTSSWYLAHGVGDSLFPEYTYIHSYDITRCKRKLSVNCRYKNGMSVPALFFACSF